MPIEAQLETVKSNASPKANPEARALREEGNELFADGKYANAMKKFNDSLRLAENGSEEVGLAYANRSSCFLHMKLLDERMVDLKLAKKSNYPTHFMPKLEKRIAQCTVLLKNKQLKSKFEVHEPTLSFVEHTKFAGVTDCLDIWTDDEYGRHVITTRDLEVGQTILVEKAFSMVPTKRMNMGRDRCVNCFREFKIFITCENCINSRFCYDGCMEQSNHSLNCNLPTPQAQPQLSQLVLEILFKANEAFPDVDILMKTVDTLLNGEEAIGLTNVIQREFRFILQLTSNHGKRSDAQIDQLRNV
ncbi:SET and MYND domain-containing protein 4-like, partial [Sitodiplosis mosellana]|uniref:SET and MYND domain-containing protein 4-like n=1 Tax=Sitodiplosis mosellana TaxID=263140 RepID=UPI0024447AD6